MNQNLGPMLTKKTIDGLGCRQVILSASWNKNRVASRALEPIYEMRTEESASASYHDAFMFQFHHECLVCAIATFFTAPTPPASFDLSSSKSESTIFRANSLNVTVGSQPRICFALEASALRASTSAGRK